MTLPVRAAGAAAALVVAFAIAGCAPKRAPPRASAYVGQRLDLAAPDLSGREIDVGAEQGKVRVVDFWASWCDPCREAFPHLDALAADLGPSGVSVYAVSFDEDREQIAEFLRQVPVRFPVLWDRGGHRLSSRFEVNRLPMTLVVDRSGVVRLVQDGWSDAKGRETRREVQKLLDER